MISKIWTCRLCTSKLEISKRNNVITFFCPACGFSGSGPSGYDTSKSYEWISKHRKSLKSTKKKAFPTRKKYTNRSKRDVIQLERDTKIIENANEIFKNLEESKVHPIIDQIIRDRGHLTVFYKKLKKSLPDLGRILDSSIQIPGLRKKLLDNGIKKLYKYQEVVAKQILDGNNVIISAPTGLGKTEAFLIPILHAMIQAEPDPRTREGPQALLIYPTKALASDQRDKIVNYCSVIGLTVAIFDGDTKQNLRREIFRHPPDILITNPDMIHYHLMSNVSFQSLIMRVRYVVIDEIHLCVGSYGTNVLWIIRRLRRFAPGLQCIGASATISNAENFATTIFDRPTTLVSVGTARKSDLNLTMIYPKERSNLSTMAQVTEHFLNAGIRTLSFGNGHLSAESLNLMLK
ncbi:MAG: DEAD/DEAH box helicase, partial [Candidatus Kariarchaeaceae archaeon]